MLTDECKKNENDNSSTHLLDMYVDFIGNQLLPEIQYLALKFKTFWAFKPNSSLKAYMEEHQYTFKEFFLPQELLDALVDIIDTNYMTVEGNDALIIPDKKLQKCFASWMFLKKDLTSLCLNHIMVAPANVVKNLQNVYMKRDLSVNAPHKLIYDDTSSRFWIHPTLNLLMNRNKNMSYTFEELYFMFLDFCTTDAQHFSRISEDIIVIHSHSEISKLFQFKYFHLNQISALLKQATFFLGRSNNLQKLWKKKVLPDTLTEKEINQACDFIDNIINSNHNLSATIFFSTIGL